MFSLKLTITSPKTTKKFDSCTSINVPGSRGEMCILPGHESIMCSFKDGVVKVSEGNNEKSLDEFMSFFVSNGMMKIINHDGHSEVLIMTENIELIDDLDLESCKKQVADFQSNVNSEPDQNSLITLKRNLEIAKNKLDILERI